eukprot:gene32183-16723_t
MNSNDGLGPLQFELRTTSPTDENMQTLIIPTKDFLERFNLTIITPVFNILFSQLGAMNSYKPDELITVRNDVKVLNDFPDTDARCANVVENAKAFGAEDASIHEWRSYAYNSIYNADELAQGYPWKLRALQGKYNTRYTGSFASQETIPAVLDYNMQLINEELCV